MSVEYIKYIEPVLQQARNTWEGLKKEKTLWKELKRQRVTLVLGSDREIGRENNTPERRVGISPAQAKELREYLKKNHIELELLVVRGAGERAGYPDSQYISEADAEIVEIDELKCMDWPADVVHGLKEPSKYEAAIRGPILRIGALHTGAFSEDTGLAEMFKTMNFAAIFDGSFVGGCSFKSKYKGLDNIPIRGTMSLYAGMDAASSVLKLWREKNNLIGKEIQNEKFIVIGGGPVGCAAAVTLANEAPKSRVLLFDIDPENPKKNLEAFKHKSSNLEIMKNDDKNAAFLLELRQSAGLVTAIAGKGKPRRVVDKNDIATMKLNCVIVDVSIDEGGCVWAEGIKEGMSSGEIADVVRTELNTTGVKPQYIVEFNQPRKYARYAAVDHGYAILPYLAALLHLTAHTGDTVKAMAYILLHECPEPAKAHICELLTGDLHNGMAFANMFLMNDSAIKGKPVIEEYIEKLKNPGCEDYLNF